MNPAVSVVVPTCGRPDLLRRCVAALETQSLASDAYEIIVVDDTLTRRGPAAVRNIGWRRARAPIVAFTDDDTVPDRDWLARGLAAFAPDIDAVTGRIVMPLPATPTDYERNEQGLERAEFVTANCFVRREVLARLGGFDESFRLLEAGSRIARAPDAVVVHPVRPAAWGVSLRQQRKVMFDALLLRKHRALYRERIRRVPRWDYYAVVAALALSPFWPPAIIIWIVLTARFCLYRLRGTSKAPAHIAEVVITSILIPPVSVFWRLVGALKFRAGFG